MKTFIIKQNFIADSGFIIYTVKAESDQKALTKFMEHNHMGCVPVGTHIYEITEGVQEVYRYDNPNYEG